MSKTASPFDSNQTLKQVALAELIKVLGYQIAIILSPSEISQTACFNI
jgi:hypothetical protein